ncbi:hypothetical protein [Parasphingorhabdus sp.]|uniref:linalool dehydratase/isomerase domain-containing protein n=1 Tax=Parasphingorhabdus sp. TaxID=2709688 RepID=UPI0032ED5E67
MTLTKTLDLGTTENEPSSSQSAQTVSKPIDFSQLPQLDEKQVGALRHIENLANLPENDWSGMMGRAAMQEDHGAYRYQLAFMSMALALAHRHRLPAAPGVFKDTFDKLIKKILHPEVWLYWRQSSQGKGPMSIDAPKLPMETDPVGRDNIMYSAYVQVMTLMYHALFDDDKYSKKGAISFEFKPTLSVTDEIATFKYDERSLNEHLYWKMVETGYLGVACEPYCIFQVCNQVPILGFRLHDWLYGTDTAEEVTAGFVEAWNGFGGALGTDGHYHTLVYTHEKIIRESNGAPWADSWCGMLMNAWNSEFVRGNYPKQRDDWLVAGPAGTRSLKLPPPIEGYDMPEGSAGDFGWTACFASEMGDEETLQGMLAHADKYMNPTWREGGYFYPRNDSARDDFGNLTIVDPTTGNALLAYARLNIKDGLKKLYEQPWDDDHFDQPLITKVSDNTNLLRAIFLKETGTLVLTVDQRAAMAGDAELEITNFDQGDRSWRMCVDGEKVAYGDPEKIECYGPVSVTRDSDTMVIHCPNRGAPTLTIEWG